MSDERYQLWGGCFDEEPSTVLRRLNDSLEIDSRLFREDIEGSKAWAAELKRSGHLAKDDNEKIQLGLNKVEKDIEIDLKNGRLKDAEEDIHSVVERRLKDYAGESALRLHTGRSRNDQSATDTKLWMMTSIQRAQSELLRLIMVLSKRAREEIDIITSGYTHLQRAQPIRWSHFLLSYVWMFRDDFIRLEEQKNRLSSCPLGSGAIAGCALPIDRRRLAQSLGFNEVTPNSMFAVGSRDHIVEFLNWASLCGIHLSRLAEDLIIYSSQEFSIIQHSDQFSTGSSLMPQKRNPDGLELVRGAAGILLGNAFSFSCILKGLPSTYNKDLQSDKEILFRSYDKLMDCFKVTTGTVDTMKVDAAKTLKLLDPGMLATDLAHALVRRGVPFRRAHHLVGSALRRAAALGLDLQQLPHHEYNAICPEFGTEEDLRKIFSWEASVEQYTSEGGTSKAAVLLQLQQLEKIILTGTVMNTLIIKHKTLINKMSLQILKMTTLLSVLFTTHEILALELNSLVIEPHSYTQNLRVIPNLSKSDKEYIQHINSMINAYKRNMDSKILVETSELINTKYQTWKRNGDLINSLLTLPKDMMDAGR